MQERTQSSMSESGFPVMLKGFGSCQRVTRLSVFSSFKWSDCKI